MRREKQRGSCMGYLFLLGVGIVLIGLAFGDAKALWNNKEPVEMTLAEYQNSDSKAEWLTLNECELDFGNAVYRYSEKTNVISQVYIPLRVPGSEERSAVVLKSDDFNGVISRLRDIKTEEGFITWAQANSKLLQPQTVEGWLTTDNKSINNKISGQVLVPGAVTLNHNESKSWGKALGFLVFGGLCLLAFVLLLAKKRSS